MSGGWIKLYWSIKESIVYSNATTFALFGHILLGTARRRNILHNGMTMEAGQCLISTEWVAKWMGKSSRTVRRHIDALERDGVIKVLKRDRNGTLVSVCNWDTYQNSKGEGVREMQANVSETSAERQRNDTQTESPKIPKSPKSPKRGEPKRFRPPTSQDLEKFCKSKEISSACIEDFLDFYSSKGWRVGNSPMKDWQAAYRGWVSRQPQFTNSQTNSNGELKL